MVYSFKFSDRAKSTLGRPHLPGISYIIIALSDLPSTTKQNDRSETQA